VPSTLRLTCVRGAGLFQIVMSFVILGSYVGARARARAEGPARRRGG
jgi:hypothetical protein